MKPLFSLLHATYGRPQKAIAAMHMAMMAADDPSPSNVEYIFATNDDDPTHVEIHDQGSWGVCGNFRGSAEAWDAAAGISMGQILIQMQDDLELPEGWDSVLIGKIIARAGMNWRVDPLVVAVGDGYRKDALLCTAICNRARYEQTKEFLHPGYLSVFSDDEWTYRALRDERDGKCTIIRAPELTFRHRHHYHDKSVPDDATYRRENSAEAYRIGGALFAERNPRAATDGLRTWQ